MAELRLVLVTPEKTLLDEPVDGLQFPLFDGQIGILPARAPMVGRLGFGELTIRTRSGETRYYIDGGFSQIKDNVVSLLTNDATPISTLDVPTLQKELDEVSKRIPTTDIDFSEKAARQDRLRKMLALARGSRA